MLTLLVLASAKAQCIWQEDQIFNVFQSETWLRPVAANINIKMNCVDGAAGLNGSWIPENPRTERNDLKSLETLIWSQYKKKIDLSHLTISEVCRNPRWLSHPMFKRLIGEAEYSSLFCLGYCNAVFQNLGVTRIPGVITGGPGERWSDWGTQVKESPDINHNVGEPI